MHWQIENKKLIDELREAEIVMRENEMSHIIYLNK